MTVLDRIYQLRVERGWSEYRLSEESGIAQTTISSWFRKNIIPTVTSLEKICSAYNITLSQFFNWDNEPTVLTEQQSELLDNWNRLTKKQQNIVIELLRSMYYFQPKLKNPPKKHSADFSLCVIICSAVE